MKVNLYIFCMIRLELCAPLHYAETPELEPFICNTDTGPEELLFCFELDFTQCRSIEPKADSLLGKLIFAGKNSDGEKTIILPAGNYLFVQERKNLNRTQCIDLVIEQQKDGLWERLKLADRIYVRYLFEDGKPVTQLFRAYTG